MTKRFDFILTAFVLVVAISLMVVNTEEYHHTREVVKQNYIAEAKAERESEQRFTESLVRMFQLNLEKISE